MSSAADPLVLALFPRPQRLLRHAGSWIPARTVRLSAPASLQGSPAIAWLARALEQRGHRLDIAEIAGSGEGKAPAGEKAEGEGEAEASIRLRLGTPGAGLASMGSAAPNPSAAYTLVISKDEVVAGAANAAGLAHALCTLVQLVTAPRGENARVELPCLAIEDWPDFAQRGVMLDISRDKVPTRATLRALIDRLALWKVNQLQLYMEHTFAYAGHETVWGAASPLDAGEVRDLSDYCAARHIELVPNQNSFGHMHRWLRHEPYRALAECPDGFEHPWNWTGEPYGLCATDPASLEFLTALYDELLPNFQSRLFNVGLDETIDLGAGRSRAACEARGTERVYLDFLKQVHALLEARGKVMQFWGDIIVKRPDLVPELPEDAIALEWGYEADHPFAEHLALFRQAGLDFYVCPGTSSWCSIAGRTDNAVLNIARAAREGKAAGASGLLVTDWGDHGHLQPLCVSYLGLLVGAGLAWNVSDAEDPSALDVPRLLDQHVFHDSAGVLGRAAHDLGNTYTVAGSLRANASVLFWSLIKPERLLSPPGVSRASLEKTLEHIDRATAELGRARPGSVGFLEPAASEAREGSRVVAELGWAADVLRLACRLGLARLASPDPESLGAIEPAARAGLARQLDELIMRHRALWLERNESGGLDDSTRRLEQLRLSLEA